MVKNNVTNQICLRFTKPKRNTKDKTKYIYRRITKDFFFPLYTWMPKDFNKKENKK